MALNPILSYHVDRNCWPGIDHARTPNRHGLVLYVVCSATLCIESIYNRHDHTKPISSKRGMDISLLLLNKNGPMTMTYSILLLYSSIPLYQGLCKLENEILREAKKPEKSLKNHIFRPKNVIFDRFEPLSKVHFPAGTTLIISLWDLRWTSRKRIYRSSELSTSRQKGAPQVKHANHWLYDFFDPEFRHIIFIFSLLLINFKI